MNFFVFKLPFLLELFFNGFFILVYSLVKLEKIPQIFPARTFEFFLNGGVYVVPVIIFFNILANFYKRSSFDDFVRRYVFSFVVLIPMLIAYGDLEFTFWLSSAHLLSSVLSLYDDKSSDDSEETSKTSKNFFQILALKPAQMVLFSFGSVIAIGTFLLMLPISSASGESLGLIDSLFMATSATCVTGLSVLSLGDDYSFFGQVVILTLIQIGGLSIMTLYASMTLLLGKSMGMKGRVLMQDVLDVGSLEDLFELIVDIIKYALVIELWGAMVLTLAFIFDGMDFTGALYSGVFHSISAFCNAGFSLFNTSLESYSTRPWIHGTVAILVTLGGLGFIVLKEMKQAFKNRWKFNELTLHTRVVLVVSFFLTFSGAVILFFSEFLYALDPYSLWEKTQIALFHSVTLRTSGFNTIPMTDFQIYSISFMLIFMFIGGAPGSTAGGIKVTTFAILFQSTKATLLGRKKVTLFDRTIVSPTVVKSTAITFMTLMFFCCFFLLLLAFEREQNFFTLFFEAFSALGTVGLSLGVTDSLTAPGKTVIMILMFIGRIGPLTLLLAIAQRSGTRGKFDYPEGRIMIG